MEKLINIQAELKAPKSQRNSFGGYSYRSCEDILEAVKPLLQKHDVALIIRDSMESIYDRVYVKSTAMLFERTGGLVAEAHAYAREAENKKGMDEAQITGSASSYARKYALNGLFCIDDTKDADATNDHGKGKGRAPKPSEAAMEKAQKQRDAKMASDDII
jgi:hypothetical protein